MKLKHEKIEINIVDSEDFSRFVQSIYGENFDFVADHEANNYSEYKFKAPNVCMDWEGEGEKKIRKGKFSGIPINTLFNVLLKDGHIEEGHYLIKVFW